MTLAVATGTAVLSLIGLAVGLVVAVLVVALFNRVLVPALEIRDYAQEIHTAGLGIVENLESVDKLERTRELSMAVPELAVTYLEKSGGGAR